MTLVSSSLSDGVAVLRLDDPDRRNALSKELSDGDVVREPGPGMGPGGMKGGRKS